MSHTPPVDRYPPSLVKSALVVLIAFVAAAAFAWLLGRTAGDGGAASLAWMGTPWGAALVGTAAAAVSAMTLAGPRLRRRAR